MNGEKGNGAAAVVALITALVILVLGVAYLAFTGKGEIGVRDNIPAAAEMSLAESSITDSSLAESKADSSSAAESVADLPVKAADYAEINDDGLTAENAILVDAADNKIIAGKNYDKRIYPASLTKVMSLIVAAENIQDFNAAYTFTNEDIDSLAEENASVAEFEAGETVNMTDLMYASIVVSGGDGTKGLANAVAGSEKAFVNLMNKKVQEMGLKNTHFSNASGLHDDNHYSTCEDMAVIMKYAMENEMCRKILTAKEYTTSKTDQHKDGIKLDSLLFTRLEGYFVEGGGEILGGKTGFTDEAKFTLATALEFDGKEYICITAKSEKQLAAVEDTILVYEKYLTQNEKKAAADESSSAADVQ